MAEYAIFLYGPTAAQTTQPETATDARNEHHDHAKELDASGEMIFARALAAPDFSTSIRGEVVTDGPFLDTKEMILGFYVINADNLDEALAIAKRNPILHQGGGLEIRPMES